tara:strand:+ start:18 stop:830 length:813 start_codon:yes stop_codon:yes gene_type:complete
MDAVAILLPAFVFSVLLLATHTYLGLHVLARGIIFVDLALAQIAALGASISLLTGVDAHGFEALLYGILSTLVAALGLTLIRRVPSKTTREVIIGSVYVVATALSVLVLSQSVHGMEELKALLNGSILWVRWHEIGIVAAVYAALSLIHLVFRARFHALSFAPDYGGAARTPGFLWEFLFFASFAVVIASAVHVAGILVVFAYLIIPPFTASLLTCGFVPRLILGWGLGLVATLVALAVAYHADLPVGATVVSLLGLLPLLALLFRLRAS